MFKGQLAEIGNDPPSLNDWFGIVAKANSEKIAVLFGERSLTFRELDILSDQVASLLHSHNIVLEDRVAVIMQRTPGLIGALLGILKAGGTFVPLDSSLPKERVAFILQDCNACLILTEESLVKSLPQRYGTKVPTIAIDVTQLLQLNASAAPRAVRAYPESLAYIIYTSGSTGVPKGVMVPHRGIVNYLLWCIEAYEIGKGSGAPVHTSIGFDLTLTSVFGPLLAGKPVLLLPEFTGIEPLVNAVASQADFSFIKLTPAHLDMLNEMLQGVQVKGGVRRLVVGGDALWTRTLDYWRRNGPTVHLVNEYGPTETVVGCCVYSEKIGNLPDFADRIPIGKPIANTQLYILDQDMKKVALGLAGELYIGGAGVARGYENRPDITAAQFVPDPFSGVPGARIYKSGDMCKEQKDGNLEYLGRVDRQVKIRGYRVELDEIAIVLMGHPRVKDVVVVSNQETLQGSSVSAYIIFNAEISLSNSDLREWLASKLPDYMIPNSFVTVKTFPLTPNGKVDRDALVAHNVPAADPPTDPIDPQNSVERLLVRMWMDILGRSDISINDNFFELGGDSIRAIRLVSRIRTAGYKLTPRQIFDYPTVNTLAPVLEVARPTASIRQDQIVGPAPLTPMQQWFISLGLPNPNQWNQVAMLAVPSDIQPAILDQAVKEVLHHHDALRLRFKRSDSEWTQFNAVDAPECFSMIELSGSSSAKKQGMAKALRRLGASLDLAQGMLLKVILFRFLGQREAKLVVVSHHLVVDLISWQILLEDLALAYEQLRSGAKPNLPSKTTSYKQWAERVTELAHSPAMQDDVNYWASAALPRVKQLPRDYVGKDNSFSSTRVFRAVFNVSDTKRLTQVASEILRVRLHEILLAALIHVLRKWTRHDATAVHVEGHGRDDFGMDVDLSRTVGWFTALYPVHIDLTEADAFNSALAGLRQQLGRVPHKGMSYGLLRYLSADAAVRAKLSMQSPPEILFNFLGFTTRTVSPNGRWKLLSTPIGSRASGRGLRPYTFEIHSVIEEGSLVIKWYYSGNLHNRTTVERLMLKIKNLLMGLLADPGCVSPALDSFSSSGLSDSDVQRLLSRYSKFKSVSQGRD